VGCAAGSKRGHRFGPSEFTHPTAGVVFSSPSFIQTKMYMIITTCDLNDAINGLDTSKVSVCENFNYDIIRPL
jgi:hypothetical protein